MKNEKQKTKKNELEVGALVLYQGLNAKITRVKKDLQGNAVYNIAFENGKVVGCGYWGTDLREADLERVTEFDYSKNIDLPKIKEYLLYNLPEGYTVKKLKRYVRVRKDRKWVGDFANPSCAEGFVKQLKEAK